MARPAPATSVTRWLTSLWHAATSASSRPYRSTRACREPWHGIAASRREFCAGERTVVAGGKFGQNKSITIPRTFQRALPMRRLLAIVLLLAFVAGLTLAWAQEAKLSEAEKKAL